MFFINILVLLPEKLMKMMKNAISYNVKENEKTFLDWSLYLEFVQS